MTAQEVRGIWNVPRTWFMLHLNSVLVRFLFCLNNVVQLLLRYCLHLYLGIYWAPSRVNSSAAVCNVLSVSLPHRFGQKQITAELVLAGWDRGRKWKSRAGRQTSTRGAVNHPYEWFSLAGDYKKAQEAGHSPPRKGVTKSEHHQKNDVVVFKCDAWSRDLSSHISENGQVIAWFLQVIGPRDTLVACDRKGLSLKLFQLEGIKKNKVQAWPYCVSLTVGPSHSGKGEEDELFFRGQRPQMGRQEASNTAYVC